MLTTVADLIREALITDGAHHKQWYLEQIAILLGIPVDDLDAEKGVMP